MMALRSGLGRLHGLSKSLVNFQGPRYMVSVTTPVNADTPSKEIPTHTGQKFEEGDYRLVRFIDKQKQVNQRFAIDLIDEVPPSEKQSRVVWCDGGGGPTGHPRVYINLKTVKISRTVKVRRLNFSDTFGKGLRNMCAKFQVDWGKADQPGNHACGYCGLRFFKKDHHH